MIFSSDSDIQALVDCELDPERRRNAMAAIMASPVLMERFAALLEQKRLLKAYWKRMEH